MQTSKTAGETEAAVVLPPLPPDGGKVRVANCARNLLRLEAKHIRGDHGDDRSGAGAKVLRAAADLDAAVGIDLRFGLSAAAAAAPGGRWRNRRRSSSGPGELPGFLYFAFQPKRSAPS